MSNDISGFGTRINIRASNTFPIGFNITQFADDADPLDAPSIQVADKAMGLNGDLITWSTANPLEATINVIPGSEDDSNLSILLEANRVSKGKQSARDKITMTTIYPSGNTVISSKGRITNGPAMNSIASAGRLKTNAYTFVFENQVKS